MFRDLDALPFICAVLLVGYYKGSIEEAVQMYRKGRSFVKVIGHLEVSLDV